MRFEVLSAKKNQIKTKHVLSFSQFKKNWNKLTKFYNLGAARELGVERKAVNQHFRAIS